LGLKFQKFVSIDSFDLTPLKLLIENCVRVSLALTWITVQYVTVNALWHGLWFNWKGDL